MVQVFESEDPRKRLADTLGMSLGQGLGNGLSTFFANRSLDSVLQDKALEGAPQSKKLEAIRSALSPYGEKGQEIFNQRLQIEGIERQEKETAKQEALLKKQEALQKLKGTSIRKLTKGEQLSDEEWSRFTPQEVAALQKAYNPKDKTPISERPLEPQQLNAIETAQSDPNWNKMNVVQKFNSLLKAGVSPPNAEKEAKLYVETAKTEHDIQTDDRDYHSKISRPIIEQAQKTLKDSSIEKGIEQQLRRDIDSGNTSGLIPFMVDKMGLESWRNPESARFTNGVKNLFIGALNEIPGARPNQFIERFLSTAQPLIGRDPEANLSVLDVSDFVRDVRDEHARLELEEAKKDRTKLGYAKDDISERAWDKMGDYVNRRQEKMALDIRERHEKDRNTSDLMAEVLNGNVPPNTPLTPKMMKIFYIKNNKNIDAAISEAKKNNFVLPEFMD
jgi:hypothetical protein